jgi:hypothetical protein
MRYRGSEIASWRATAGTRYGRNDIPVKNSLRLCSLASLREKKPFEYEYEYEHEHDYDW